MALVERARSNVTRVSAWLVARSPRQLLVAGWIGAILLCYPGYLGPTSIAQLGEVRSGVYSDANAPLMTLVWSVCEWVFAGPFLMLALQMGLFVIGAYGTVRRVLAPRPAAIVAIAALVIPPVFAAMAVVAPDALAVGALLAAFAAFVDGRRRLRIAGIAALVLAFGCRPELAAAALPIALFAIPRGNRLWRGLAATALVIACAATACGASALLVDRDTHAWQQDHEWADVIGTLRRAHDTNASLAGLPILEHAKVTSGKAIYSSHAVIYGPDRVADPITSDDEADALSVAWHRAIVDHPGAYAAHRVLMFARVLGLVAHLKPMSDDFGNRHLVQLHHRATPSDLEIGWRAIVHAVEKTPLFSPWLYVVLAIAALVLARRRRELVALVTSGLIAELTLLPFAPESEYRFSLWLVATTWLAVLVIAASRRQTWQRAAA